MRSRVPVGQEMHHATRKRLARPRIHTASALISSVAISHGPDLIISTAGLRVLSRESIRVCNQTVPLNSHGSV